MTIGIIAGGRLLRDCLQFSRVFRGLSGDHSPSLLRRVPRPCIRHHAVPAPLLVLFIGSGCAALIYELVWFQMLELVIGSSAVSLAVLLGTFMGGMCLGNLALPRLVAATRHPLRVYAMIELGLGLGGIAVPAVMPAVGRLYVESLGSGHSDVLLRAAVCVVCLLPSTMLMGATLPAVARWTETTPRGVSWLGIFYGGNSAGAVVGCLLVGFYLLRVHDLVVASWCAVVINASVALGALGLAAAGPARPDTWTPPAAETTPPSGARAVLVSIALSGFCALGAEVIWTRLLSLLLGATVYTFSIILATFLAGLGLGGIVGGVLARRGRVSVSAGASCCRWRPSGGPPTCWRALCPSGPAVTCRTRTSGSNSGSTSCNPVVPSCPPPASGARVSRWR